MLNEAEQKQIHAQEKDREVLTVELPRKDGCKKKWPVLFCFVFFQEKCL